MSNYDPNPYKIPEDMPKREIVLKLGQMITNRMGRKITYEDAEYWGLQGIVTDRDIILRCVAPEDDPSRVPVKNIMTRHPKALSPADDVRQAAQIMAIQQVRRLPVVEDGRVVGLVSLGDLAKCGKFEMEVSKALTDISENVKRV